MIQTEDHQRAEPRGPEAVEQVGDAQGLAARERVTAEHHATCEYREEQDMREPADDRDEREHEHQDAEDQHQRDPRARRGGEHAPAFAPPRQPVARGQPARLWRARGGW
jgi:hypothetical protein